MINYTPKVWLFNFHTPNEDLITERDPIVDTNSDIRNLSFRAQQNGVKYQQRFSVKAFLCFFFI